MEVKIPGSVTLVFPTIKSYIPVASPTSLFIEPELKMVFFIDDDAVLHRGGLDTITYDHFKGYLIGSGLAVCRGLGEQT